MRRAFAACAAAARAWAPPALAGVSIASLRGSHAPLCGRGPTSGLGVRLLSSFTPGADTASEFEVKKSIFKASLAEAHSASAARAWVALNSDAKANHNCWACILPDMSRMSDDDGEPSGTAAKPILAALEQAQLGGAVLLVTRYRRGPKLGAGGLVRAYGAAARQCVAAAALVEHKPSTLLTIIADVSRAGDVYSALRNLPRVEERHDGTTVEIDVRIDTEDGAAEAELRRRVQDATAGAARVVEARSRRRAEDAE